MLSWCCECGKTRHAYFPRKLMTRLPITQGPMLNITNGSATLTTASPEPLPISQREKGILRVFGPFVPLKLEL